ncbi:hypothetical protein FG91_01631 [Sphingopyxis sp. LC81]|nr:hypothetical protein FG91_01631 [Sphingopyxis sp. LC81]
MVAVDDRIWRDRANALLRLLVIGTSWRLNPCQRLAKQANLFHSTETESVFGEEGEFLVRGRDQPFVTRDLEAIDVARDAAQFDAVANHAHVTICGRSFSVTPLPLCGTYLLYRIPIIVVVMFGLILLVGGRNAFALTFAIAIVYFLAEFRFDDLLHVLVDSILDLRFGRGFDMILNLLLDIAFHLIFNGVSDVVFVRTTLAPGIARIWGQQDKRTQQRDREVAKPGFAGSRS